MVKEREGRQTLAILKYPGWWVENDEVVGFGQISPNGGPNHVLWGKARGHWEPMPKTVVVVIRASNMKSPHFSYNYPRAIRV